MKYGNNVYLRSTQVCFHAMLNDATHKALFIRTGNAAYAAFINQQLGSNVFRSMFNSHIKRLFADFYWGVHTTDG